MTDAGRLAGIERAAAPLVEMVKTWHRGGCVYQPANVRPFEILPDGRMAIDYQMLREIVDAMGIEIRLDEL